MIVFMTIQSYRWIYIMRKDGEMWYREHYPKIPEPLYPIIARYHWGEPITNKAIGDEYKKKKKRDRTNRSKRRKYQV